VILSLVMPYYLNPGQLALQYRTWAGWSGDAKARVEIVLVDDGSPVRAIGVERPEGLPALSIYRVTEDRPWHQHGARNLGARVAKGPWLLLTDMDHVLTAENAERMLARLPTLDRGAAYMLDRVEAETGKPTLGNDGQPKPHPNSFVMTRKTYWKVGGYDEDLCGVYGTDSAYRSRLYRTAKRGHLDIPLIRYSRDIVPDASTTTLARKEGREPNAVKRIMGDKARRGKTEPKVLAFEWEQVL
jgi:hypothetical protein